MRWFSANMGSVGTELTYGSGFQLLVAVILSAQCTDKRVNLVTPALFGRYPTAVAMSEATEGEIYAYIRSCSYPNAKSRHLLAMSRMLVTDFGGEVPANREQLLRLPGVGRKTANVVLAVLYQQAVMPVDTHVFRVSARLGLTHHADTPLQCEQQLINTIPTAMLTNAHHWLILHGRNVCTARKPKCVTCGLSAYCEFYQQNTKHRPTNHSCL